MSARSKLRHQPQPRPRPRAWIVVVGLLAIGLGIVLMQGWRTWRSASGDAESPPTAIEPPPLPALAKSAHFETMQAAHYVGSNACIECHRDQHTSYLQTGHSRSFGPVDLAEEPPDGQFARDDSNWKYESYRSDGQLRHREFLSTKAGDVTLVDRPLKYLVGSGRFSRTYLAELDGILVESPLTWYSSLDAWNLSPGFQRGPYNSFCRNISADCLYCHVGRAEYQAHDEHRGRFHELAIGCERCHGPGSVHVAKRRSGETMDGPDLTIVHPNQLARELSEAICHQCHLESDSSALVRGRRREDFRPGLRWSDFVVNVTRDSAEKGMSVTGHVQQMHLSRCYVESETLSCITCHDPHHTPAPKDRPEYYRAVCLECHTDESCRVPLAKRSAANQNDCAACHMPQSATDIAHVAFTHHRIGIHSDEPAAPTDDPLKKLVPILNVSHLAEADRERVLGLAYTRLIAQHQHDARYQALWLQAEGHLQKAAQQGLRDPSLQTALAVIARQRRDNPAARKLAEDALADPDISADDRAVATNLLAGLEFEVGNIPAAYGHFQKLTEWRLMPADWFLLGTCRQRMGDEAGAIAAYEKVLQIDATEPGTYRALAPLLEAQGKTERARELIERAALIEEHLAKLPN